MIAGWTSSLGSVQVFCCVSSWQERVFIMFHLAVIPLRDGIGPAPLGAWLGLRGAVGGFEGYWARI